MVITIVYAKYDDQERLDLWDDIYSISQNTNLLWIIGGDFNVITSIEENIGAASFLHKVDDFAFCINSCELLDINFKGSLLTWWNGKADNNCIFL